MSQPPATGPTVGTSHGAPAPNVSRLRHRNSGRHRLVSAGVALAIFGALLAWNWPRMFPPVAQPLQLRVTFAAGEAGQCEPLITTGRTGAGDFLALRYVDAQTARFVYDAWGVGGPESELFELRPGTTRTLEIEMPTLAHVSGSGRARAPVRVTLDGERRLDASVAFHARAPDQLFFATNPLGGTLVNPRFRGALATPDGRTLRGGPSGYFSWRSRLAWWLTARPARAAATVFVSFVAGIAAWALIGFWQRRANSNDTRRRGLIDRWRARCWKPFAGFVRRRPSGGHLRRLVIAAVVLAMLGYYTWTTLCSFDVPPPLRPKGEIETDHFNLLSHGFLKGHLYLDAEVPPALLAAPNPYDPLSRGKIEVIHDASYYRGKYYIYFGPTPVVSLFLPFTVLTGRDLPLTYAILLYCAGAFLASAGILLYLQRRYFRGASTPAVLAALLALGGGNMAVALLRRSNVWETAAAAGFFFFALALLCLVRALHTRRSATWALFGGLALGLAVGARPTYLVSSLLFAVPLLFRTGRAHGYGWRSLASAALGCSVPVLALLAYNYARFGAPFEFGQKYQLSTIIEGNARHFSLGYLGFNAFVYFLAPLRWERFFPFNDGIAVPPLPSDQGGYEFSFGLLSNLPFSCLGAIAVAALLGWRRRGTDAHLWPVVAVILGAALLNAAVLSLYFGSCVRYMADFAPWFMLLAGLGAFELETRLRIRWLARSFVGLAAGLAVFTALVAGLSVVRFYDLVEDVPPRAYRPIARVLNSPMLWLERARWPDYGPRELSLTLPEDRTPRIEPLVSVVRDGPSISALAIEYLGDEAIRFHYRDAGRKETLRSLPLLATRGGPHRLRVDIGGDYADFDGRNSRLRVSFDHIPAFNAGVVSLHAYPGEIVVGRDPATTNAGAFSGTLHESKRLAETARTPLEIGGARIRLTDPAALAGRAVPLITTGRTLAGDVLFAEFDRAGNVVFAYDHWGDGLLRSAPVPLTPGSRPVIEFWLPAHRARLGNAPEFIVNVDGATVWRQRASFFPFDARGIFLGVNPIGASTCAPVLDRAVLEDAYAMPPRGGAAP